MSKKKIAERRKFVRYRAKEGAIAAIRCTGVNVGEIIDISKGGLSFSYVNLDHDPKEPCELDIFLRDKGIFLKDVPFKTVSDFDMDNDLPFSSIILRRQSVRFCKLNSKQLSDLEHFISHHTSGPA